MWLTYFESWLDFSDLNQVNIDSTLHQAAIDNDLEMVDRCLDQEVIDVNVINTEGVTPLMYASLYGHDVSV